MRVYAPSSTGECQGLGGCHFKFLRMDVRVSQQFYILIFPEFSLSSCCFQTIFPCIQVKNVHAFPWLLDGFLMWKCHIKKLLSIRISKTLLKFLLTAVINNCNATWKIKIKTITTTVIPTVSFFMNKISA